MARDIPDPARTTPTASPTGEGWPHSLPTLTGALVAVRELRVDDARPLRDALATPEASAFLPWPIETPEAFERFVARACGRRGEREEACFVVVPRGSDVPIGVFHLRSTSAAFASAEWQFGIAHEFWGTGVFPDAASQVVRFAAGAIGTRRLDARTAAGHTRVHGALRKIGAVQTPLDGCDQVVWSMHLTPA